MEIRQASQRSLRDRVRIWLAILDRPQNFQRALLRICGTLDLSITLIPLVWLLASWYPLDRVARDTMPVLIAVMLTVAAGVALWVVPWERLPPAAILPVLVVGTIDTTILVGYTHRQSSFLLYFLWVGFGAIFLPRDLGVLGTGLVSGASLWIGATAGQRGEAVEILFVVVPCYIIVLISGRLWIERIQTLQRQQAEARQANARLAALHDLCTLLSSEHRVDQLLADLVNGLAKTFGYRHASVYLFDDDRLKLQAQIGYTTPIGEFEPGEGITGIVGQRGVAMLVRDGPQHPDYRFVEDPLGSQASVPLIHHGRVLGVLNLEGAPGELGDEDLRLLETLASPAAIALENAALVGRLDNLAHRDPLTQLPNRRGIIAALETALAGDDATVTILLVDLNGFKAVNDRYGHAMGDTLLIELADLLERCVRTNRDRPDIVGRLGGDEFLVVLPGADDFGAVLVVERLTATLSGHSFALLTPDEHRPPPVVGYSLGIATAPADGTDPTGLLAVADRAMYRAKRGTTGPIRFIARHAPASAKGIAS